MASTRQPFTFPSKTFSVLHSRTIQLDTSSPNQNDFSIETGKTIMSEYRVTEAGIIAWVNNTDEGREAWDDHRGGSIEDYLVEYADYEDILDLLAGDLGYPGDKETNAPGADIDEYSLLLNLDANGDVFLTAELSYSLSELDETERANKGDEIGVVEGKSLQDALINAVASYPAAGAISTLSQKALSKLQA